MAHAKRSRSAAADPGKHTTALLLLRLLWGEGEFIETRFDEIPAAVLRGEADYGVLIHETQITHRSMGLERVMDLGEAWGQETGLPIPLGLDVIRKDLGRDTALLLGDAFRRSIEIARTQRAAALEYARGFSRGLAPDLNDRFVGMYVNDDTLEIGEEGERALNLLFEKAHRAGLIPTPSTADILR